MISETGVHTIVNQGVSKNPWPLLNDSHTSKEHCPFSNDFKPEASIEKSKQTAVYYCFLHG